MRLAQVILDIPTHALDKPFSYLALDSQGEVSIGCCVLVDFSNRPAVGYVVGIDALDDGDDVSRYKPIERVLSEPYFDEKAADDARWIAHEYLSPLSEAVRLFAPPGGTPKVRKAERRDEGESEPVEIAESDGEPSGKTPWELVDASQKPVDDRWVSITDEGRRFVPPRVAVKQRAVLEALAEGEMRVPELALSVGSINACIKALEKRGLVSITSRRRIRGNAAPLPARSDTLKLTTGQDQALSAVMDAYRTGRGDVVLLDGITGSGKTEVYLQAIRTVIEEGHDAIVLVPEISLTPQTVGRFRARFGEQVAVLHSGMGIGERFDQWDLCRSGSAHVVVGARSALFAPLHDVRLIVIDEEHESTYKQDSSPRYHSREVAAHMVRHRGGALVLGSATPSLESLERARKGTYLRIELPERANGRQLPPVQVIDLAQEFRSGYRSMFSAALTQGLESTIEEGHKAVLLYNHRGFASYLQCRECGFVPTCDECSVSLTYHFKGVGGKPDLQCHHCGAVHPVPGRCPKCGSPYIKKVGKGTEQVHAALRELMGPDVAIVRMDADTTRTKGAHERLLGQFEAESSGILLGTQMIAKGLDFPDVTLVGVINADTILNLPDFRSAERTYQLLEQVSGRAGRDELAGKVIIQTYWPKHPSIRAVAAHDRSIFLDEELAARRELFYPPFSRLVNVLLWGKDRIAVERESLLLGESIRTRLDADTDGTWRLLGPSPCVLERLKGSWRWHMIVKAPLTADFHEVLGGIFHDRRSIAGINVAVDVDPVSLL